MNPIVRLASLKTVDRFKEHLRSLEMTIPCDHEMETAKIAAASAHRVRPHSRFATGSQFNRWKDGTELRMAIRASTQSAAGNVSARAAQD